MNDRLRRKRYGSLLAALLIWMGTGSSVNAQDRYVCDCAPGADVDCIAGSDTSSGTAESPWQSYQQARAAFAALQPGEAVRFCRGGSWQVSGNAQWVNDACMAASPCVVGAYEAPWVTGDEPRPILKRIDGDDGFNLENGGGPIQQQGYRFEDLHLVGTGGDPASYSGRGFFFYNNVDDVTISNVRIERFALGINIEGANGCAPEDSSAACRSERIVLRDSEIVNNTSQGWLGASSGSGIFDSVFDGNGSGSIFHHNVYLASEAEIVGMQVVGNVVRNNSLDPAGRCSSASLAGHGRLTDLLIEGNLVTEDPGTANNGCWGITIDPAYSSAEQFLRMVIRGNTVRNVGNVSIGTASCIDCVIESNQIIQQSAIGGSAIEIPNRLPGSGDAIDTGMTIRNNSIAYADGGIGISIGLNGTGHRIVNNAVAALSSGIDCFATDLPSSAFLAMDYNLCDAGISGNWAFGVGDLAAWQASSGLDTNSTAADPQFRDPASGDLSAASAASPMIGSGLASESAALAIDGQPRDAQPDRGAHEWRDDLIFASGFEQTEARAILHRRNAYRER